MKLIVAIVQDADSRELLDALVADGFRATKVSTTGGFLVRGNATILLGVQDAQVDVVLQHLKTHCHARREYVSPVVPMGEAASARHWVQPLEVQVGGATVFVLDVERFEQL